MKRLVADGQPQDDNSGFENSEDCLTLNVIRPFGIYKGGQQAPVVAWSRLLADRAGYDLLHHETEHVGLVCCSSRWRPCKKERSPDVKRS